jgi:hypothetical protein
MSKEVKLVGIIAIVSLVVVYLYNAYLSSSGTS